VASLDVLDITTTTITVDDLVTLIANTITGEDIALSTTAGASMDVQTEATQGTVQTTSLHPLVLGANSVDNLTCNTDGRVVLNTTGNAAGHLVDKNYVDTQIAAVEDGTTVSMVANGWIKIPNDSANDLIIQWLTVGPSSNDVALPFTWPIAFPNAVFQVFGTYNFVAGGGNDGSIEIHSITTTGATFYNRAERPVTASSVMAIGY
jgi:hypothetical protein